MFPSSSRWRSARRSRPARARAVAALAITVATFAVAPPVQAATPSAGIIGGSRITAGIQTTATAQRGDTLYLGGEISSIGYRSAGLAATDPATGKLDLGVPELRSRGEQGVVESTSVVADGRGGVYVFGVQGRPDDGAFVGDVRVTSRWLHLGPSGAADTTLAGRLTVAGDEPVQLRDAAVAADGTTYLSGTFDAVDGQKRPGLAAIDRDGKLLPWSPSVSGGPVARLYVAGGSVLLVGGVTSRDAFQPVPAPFTAVGGQGRSGLALVSGTDGSVVQAWKPVGLDQRAAGRDVTSDGTSLFMVADDGKTIRAVSTSGAGAVRDLGVRPDGSVSDVVAAGGSLYVSGFFLQIGSQATQPSRRGLAEIDPTTGGATAWAPPTNRGTQGALAVTADAVYVGGDSGREDPCGAAYRRTDATRTSWRPEFNGAGGGCIQNQTVRSLAISGGRMWAAGGLGLSNAQARQGFAAIDIARDEILPWAPSSNGNAPEDMDVSPDGQSVYIAGELISSLNDQPRGTVGAVASTGAADRPTDVRPFDPAPDGPVRRLAFSPDGSALYLGGAFRKLGDVDRPYLAAVAPSTGAASPWKPTPDAPVDDVEVASSGSLYVAGQFTTIGGVDRRFLAAFGSTPGAPTAWDPKLEAPAPPGGDLAVTGLAVGPDTVYVAGRFDGTIGGKARRGVAALDPATGMATDWDAKLDGGVDTVSTTADGTVYLASASSGSFREVQGKARPASIASLSPAGAVTRWAPGTPANRQDNAYLTNPDSFSGSHEIREVAGHLVVPVRQTSAFQGLQQDGFLSFGPAGPAPGPRSPAQPPTVVGEASIDSTVICRPGSYTGDTPLLPSYAWLVDGKVVAGQTTTEYTIRQADAGGQLTCRETVGNVSGELATSSAPVRAQDVLPTNEAAPEVTGTPQPGQTLRCSDGLWSTRVVSYTYRWLRGGTAIAGAVGSTYVPVVGDVGASVACEVVAVNGAGPSAPARSAGRTIVAAPTSPGGPPTGGGRPPVTGTTPPATQGTTPPPSTGTTAPPSTGTAAPSPTTPSAPTAPKPKLSISARVKAVKGRKITLTLSPSAAGKVTVSATTGSGRKKVTVGSGRATAKKAGSLQVTVSPSRKGKKALRAGRTAKITFKVTFTRTDGSKVTATRTIKVKIKR